MGLTVAERAVPMDERFWPWVAVGEPDECWEWMGPRVPNGYGKFTFKHVDYGAHRVAYTLAVGPIPDGFCVCHHCDNKPCFYPSHLFAGTHSDNAWDKVRKGRGCVGELNGRAKLTVPAVLAIRERRGEGYAALAQEFGVSTCAIGYAARRETWAHV